MEFLEQLGGFLMICAFGVAFLMACSGDGTPDNLLTSQPKMKWYWKERWLTWWRQL